MTKRAEAKLGLYLVPPERKLGLCGLPFLRMRYPGRVNIVITPTSIWKSRPPTSMQGAS